MSDDMVERAVRAMHDCHPREDHHQTWDGWLRDCESADETVREFALEWVAARRLEARAALAVVRKRMQAADDDAGLDIVDAWHYLRDELDAALAPR